MKKIITYASLAIIMFLVNFTIYNLSFNSQATPFLQEEQRVESGLLMLKTTLPAYLIASIVIAVIFYWIAKRQYR